MRTALKSRKRKRSITGSIKPKRITNRTRRVGKALHEKHLVSHLVAGLVGRSSKNDQIEILRELDCFQGVADVVTGTYNGYRLFPKTGSAKLRLMSFSTAKVLAALSGKKTSHSQKIAASTALSESTVKRELQLLRRLQVVGSGPKGRIIVSHPIRPPFKQIEAFEVKVKDWKSGIYQARNYKSFANKVSVALPLSRATRLRGKLDQFRRMRVGLVGITPTGDVKWFLRPRYQKPISSARNFLASVRLLAETQTRPV